ncbi:hypothetical protein EC957_005113 [Mortierella hygrophila]|uniref:Uncharacterized protein n=1 Tax=Mortierella hygrophila TaxID=979708 RepID=A0A9P6F157_9FUNG|nr:hypothetical protein EC957_005113 [Mortierella hygrophila]
MSQSTRNVQFLRPMYDGETKTLPEDVKTNGYFKSTDISRWDLGDYMICTGQSEAAFLNDLADLQNIKRLPVDISMFAHALYKHYEGELGTEKVKLARVNARKKLGTLVLNSKERISSKMAAENELDLEIAGWRSSQIESCNPFLVPRPITTSRSALSSRKSTARPAVFPNVSNASSSMSTSSISGDTVAQESTEDEDENHQMPGTRIETPTKAATAPAATKSSRSPRKKRKMEYTTEELWHSLLVVLQQIINGERRVVFPVVPAEMIPVNKLLFDHAVDAMQSYLAQPIDARDTLLLKDAQCSMSWVLNTMSSHVNKFFGESDGEELFGAAKDHCLVAGFEKHACSTILVEYLPVMREKGAEYLHRRLIADRGKLASDYLECPSSPPTAVLRDQVLHILLEIGEKALKASKVVRRQQAAECGEVSEAGRKVDCLLAFESIELSNVEFKLQGALEKETAIQGRKNIRLARALQEAHGRHGAGDVSVFMADVIGFVGTFYQVCPMGDVHIAGRTTNSMVFLPHTPGGLELFLQSKSLAIICNYIARLEAQGPELMKAYEMHDQRQELNQHADSLSLGHPWTPPR